MSADAWQPIHIHRDAPPHPGLGEACNGCGQCCLVEPCPVGMLVSGKRSGACRALRWNDGSQRYQCGLVSEPQTVLGGGWRRLSPLVARLARRWISAGSGCDAELLAESSAEPEKPPA